MANPEQALGLLPSAHSSGQVGAQPGLATGPACPARDGKH